MTTAIIILILVLTALQPSQLSGYTGIWKIIVLAFLILTLAICWGFSVQYYEINTHNILIKTFFRYVTIRREEIQHVEILSREQLRWSIRIFGVGGLFGYYGKFASRQLGRMTWYATDLSHGVLITTKSGKKILVTPDEQQKFVNSLPECK
jgi:hypothetical protein